MNKSKGKDLIKRYGGIPVTIYFPTWGEYLDFTTYTDAQGRSMSKQALLAIREQLERENGKR